MASGGIGMNDRNLISYIAVAEKGSFYKAAQSLYMAPQTLIQQINQLENEVNIKLLDRSSKGVELTPAGRSFYLGAKDIIELTRHTLAESRKIAETPQKFLRIGINPLPMLMPELCLAFHSEHPEVKLIFVSFEEKNWLSMLCEGTVDIVECAESRKELNSFELDFQPLVTDSRVALMLPSHPLASKERIGIEDLHTYKTYVNRLSSIVSLKKAIKEDAGENNLIEYPCDMRTVFQACFDGALYLVPSRYAGNFEPMIAKPLEVNHQWEFGLAYRMKRSEIIDDFLAIARQQKFALGRSD